MEEDRSLTIAVTTTVTQMFPYAMTRLSAAFRPTVYECVCASVSHTVGGSVLVCLSNNGFFSVLVPQRLKSKTMTKVLGSINRNKKNIFIPSILK